MMQPRKKLEEVEPIEWVCLIAFASIIVGLFLIYPPLAFILPSMAVLTLGYRRKWY